MKLTEKELIDLHGGGYGIAVTIGSAIAFLISIIDGFFNPSQCSK